MEFGVIGGDRRQAELSKLLRQDGHCVKTFGLAPWFAEYEVRLEEALQADMVVLPLPMCGEAGRLNCCAAEIFTEQLFRELEPHQLILAGQVHEEQWKEAEGLNLIDYYLREELTVANAAATAEAAIQVAMEHLDRMLLGSNCLVLGYGRIGKLLSHRLSGMGADVTATARKPADLAWIKAYGFSTLETGCLDGMLRDFDVVFNTIPARVLGAEQVKRLNPDCLCVDVASVPGIDPKAADARGVRYIWARALPGRIVPAAAAEIIQNTIYTIIKERGNPV